MRKSMCWREGDEWALHKHGSLIFKSFLAIFSSAAPKPGGFRSFSNQTLSYCLLPPSCAVESVTTSALSHSSTTRQTNCSSGVKMAKADKLWDKNRMLFVHVAQQ